jgi:hypothetical protein
MGGGEGGRMALLSNNLCGQGMSSMMAGLLS